MKIIISICILLLTNSLLAQNSFDIKLYAEQQGKGNVLFADNNEYCPVSVQFTFKLDNMKISKKDKIFVIPARTKGFQIMEISPIDTSKKWKWSYNYFFNYGNAIQKEYDSDYAYALPFKKGNSFKVIQGYNGNFSHQNENAVDFGMQIGDEVFSAREGIVINVVSHIIKTVQLKIVQSLTILFWYIMQMELLRPMTILNKMGLLLKKEINCKRIN